MWAPFFEHIYILETNYFHKYPLLYLWWGPSGLPEPFRHLLVGFRPRSPGKVVY